MPRKRTDLGPTLDAEIAARTARGESAETVFAAIGRVISTPTIRRRQRELRGKEAQAKPKTESSQIATEDIPENPPETTPIEDLNRWIGRLEKAALTAETQGNLQVLSSIAAKVAALMTLRHKATPLPKPDPNENPDYKALAAEGERRLMALARDLFAFPQ